MDKTNQTVTPIKDERITKNLGTHEWVAIVITILLGGLAFVYLSGALNSEQEINQNNQQLETMTNEQLNSETSAEGLLVTTTVAGEGPRAEQGDAVVVNYRGRLAETDEEFDNSYDRGQPFPVVLGENRVIQGWELGLLGAQAGESRTLEIPSELGYGPQGVGTIPPNSDLIFDIEVLEVIQSNS